MHSGNLRENFFSDFATIKFNLAPAFVVNISEVERNLNAFCDQNSYMNITSVLSELLQTKSFCI